MLKKLVGYAAYMSGATSLIRILTFGVGMLGIKMKSKGQYGNYATYTLIYGIAQGVFIMGVNQVIQKYGADDALNRRRFGRLAYILFGVLLAICGVAFAAVGAAFGNWAVALGLVGVPFIVIWWWARYIYRTTLDARGEARLTILSSLSNSLLTLGFIVLTDFGDALIYADFLALVLSGLVSLYFLPRAAGATFAELMKTALPREWLNELFVFGRSLWVAGQIFAATDWIQGLWTRGRLGAEAMGAWGVMHQLSQFIYMPLDMIGHAALPGLVAEKDQRDVMYRELLRLCLLAFPLVALGVAAGIPLLLQVLDFAFSLGGVASEPLALKYPEVHILLLIGGIAMPVHAVEIVAGQYAIAEGYKNAPLKVQFVSLVAIVAILFPLSAYFGLYGVLIAAGLGEAAKAFAYVAILWKPFRRNMKSTLVYTVWSSLCTFAGAFPVFYYRHWKYNWVIAFPAMIAFFVGMVIFRLAHREDFKRAWRAFRSRGAPEREEGFENAPEGFDRTLEALQVDKIREAIEAQKRQR